MRTTELSAEEFVRKFDPVKINNFLQQFSQFHVKTMPKKLTSLKGERCIMADILKVESYDVVLPVLIRSTSWLIRINEVSERLLTVYINAEVWPYQQRIQLVSDSVMTEKADIQDVLLRHIEASIEHWKRYRDKCRISLSCRAHTFIEEALRKYPSLSELRIIKLGSEYKNLEVFFPS